MGRRQDKLDQRLWEYLDAALEGKELDRLQRELKEDPALRRRLEELSALRATLAELPKAAAPANFAQRVVAQAERRGLLEEAEHTHKEGFGWFGNLTAAAAILLIAALGGAIYHVLSRPSYLERSGGDLKFVSAPGHGPATSAPVEPELVMAARKQAPLKDARKVPVRGPAVQELEEAVASTRSAMEAADAASEVLGDVIEEPIVIATSDPPETRRDVEHLLYANRFVSDHKIGMNNYVIEQSGKGQLIRVRGDSQQVQMVASQLQTLQRSSEQARAQQVESYGHGQVLRSQPVPIASNAVEPQAPRVTVQRMAQQGQMPRPSSLSRAAVPVAAAAGSGGGARVSTVTASGPGEEPAAAPPVSVARRAAPTSMPEKQAPAAEPLAAPPAAIAAKPQPAAESQAQQPLRARQLVILIQPEE